MPINAGYEYAEAQKRLDDAKTNEEKIRALEYMLSVSPSHKGAEKLRLEIKTKISKLKTKIEKERAKKTGGFSIAIKKEGAAQIALIGIPNSGKTTILNKFANTKALVADYEFTTRMPEVGVMDYNGIKVQLVEIPAIFLGFNESNKGPSLLAIARSADLIVIIIDGTRDCEQQIKIIELEFSKNFVVLKKLKSNNREGYETRKCLVIVSKILKNFKCEYPVSWFGDFKDAVWTMLDLIYVYTKQPGREKDFPPVALKKGSSVGDLARIVHHDFIDKFKFARVWGKSVKHNGSNVGLEHKLKEGDIVEFHVK